MSGCCVRRLARTPLSARRLYVTSSTTTRQTQQSTLPSHSQVVICGAGTVANSVAYHLVQSGWTDVLVLEKDRIGSGTSNFGSGTLGLFKPSADRHLISYSIELYKKLQDQGYDLGLKQCGSLNLAQTKDRLIALKRRMSYNLPKGLQCEILSGPELRKMHPLLRTEDLVGAVWVPEDAVAVPRAICHVLAKLAQDGGAKYVEGCEIRRVLTDDSRITGVETSLGNVQCEYFVNCAGMWAWELGQKSVPKVRIPAHPAEHFYVTTEDSLLPNGTPFPKIRDYDSFIYAREWENGSILVGGFEPEAKPAFSSSRRVPDTWRQQLPEDWQHFKPLWNRAIHRLPILKESKHPKLTNCPDNFTPDGKWILGETPEIDNYFVAVGMNGNSLQGAGGIGRAVSEWITQGEPTTELLPFDVRRFLDLHNNCKYLRERTKEVVGRHYSVLYPLQCEYKFARGLRASPLYGVLENSGAVFGTRMGYERPLYFDTSYKRNGPLPQMTKGTFGKPHFFEFMRDEFLACHEGVGICDMSSFTKTEIKSDRRRTPDDEEATGVEVVNYLQQLCSNDVNIPVGGIAHTGMQNERGGYENDCMLIRQAENCYFMVSPTNQQTRIFEWMRRHLPGDQSVALKDVTSMFTVLNIVGPKAQALMSELSNSDVHLHPFTYKKINVGYASDVMVMAFTNTGEQGYSLYVPSEYALHVYDRLMKVGRDYGARNVGYLTLRFLRIERFVPFWAEELDSVTTPFEVGRGYKVKLDKEYFIGKFALQRQKAEGVMKRLVMFHLEDLDPDHDIWPWGGEPVYRNGAYVGSVTSAGYGFTANKLVCLGFVRNPDRVPVTSEFLSARDAVYEVDIAGDRVKARPHIHPIALPPAGSQSKAARSTYQPKVREAIVSAKSS